MEREGSRHGHEDGGEERDVCARCGRVAEAEAEATVGGSHMLVSESEGHSAC